MRKAFDKGLILLRGHGLEDDVVRDLLMIALPFTVREGEIEEVSDILETIIREVLG